MIGQPLCQEACDDPLFVRAKKADLVLGVVADPRPICLREHEYSQCRFVQIENGFLVAPRGCTPTKPSSSTFAPRV